MVDRTPGLGSRESFMARSLKVTENAFVVGIPLVGLAAGLALAVVISAEKRSRRENKIIAEMLAKENAKRATWFPLSP